MKKNIFVLFILLILNITFIHPETKDYFTLGAASENQGKMEEALKYYEEYLKRGNDKELLEKTALKIARINLNYEKSIKNYNDFFSKYPDSKYKLIARYELANLHKMNGNFKDAAKEFTNLIIAAKDKSYYADRARINLSEMEIEEGKFGSASERLYKLIDKVGDYEENGKIYYLLGCAFSKQSLFREAEKYFLTCAGSYPLASRTPSALYELIKNYVKQGKNKEALRIAKLLKNLYADSLEASKSDELVAKITDGNGTKMLGIDFIELNKDVAISNNTNNLIKIDLDNSDINIKNAGGESSIESAFYIQLGYFSTKDNADLILEGYQKKGIKDLFIAKTRSSDSSKIFYRIVAGPYQTKESANQKILELKEKSIEAIILELGKFYE